MDADDSEDRDLQGWRRDSTALTALRAWMLAEDAHQRGGVPDDLLTHVQHLVDDLLGPHAMFAIGDHLRSRIDSGQTLTDIARDGEALHELLTVADGKRRPGFELQWQAARPRAGAAGRPAAVLVMAEHCVADPVWDRPLGTGDPVGLADLGVSDDLARALHAWNAEFERLALQDFTWSSPQDEASWIGRGLALAHDLQRELPDVDVRYFHADDDRPLRDLATG